MPTYQYACTACDDRLEVVQKFSDDPLTECATCGGRLRKVFSAVGVVFKGSGFYRTDSRSDGHNGSSRSETSDKQDSGSEKSEKNGQADSSSANSGESVSSESSSGSGGSSDSGATSGSSTGSDASTKSAEKAA